MLQAARMWGVSPRRFLGLWEPASVTVYEYDDAGRLGMSKTTTAPEWSEEDRALALALDDWEADLCPGCRQPLAETTLPDREDAYRSKPAIRCHRCTASAQGAELYKDAPHPSALLIPVELKTDD